MLKTVITVVLTMCTTGCVSILGDFSEANPAATTDGGADVNPSTGDDAGDAGAPGLNRDAEVTPGDDAATPPEDDAMATETPDTGSVPPGMDSGTAPEHDAAVAPPPPACSGSQTRCTDDNHEETCVSGQWDNATKCAHACVSGACGGVCSPGASQPCSECSNSGTETCGTNGQWGLCSASCS